MDSDRPLYPPGFPRLSKVIYRWRWLHRKLFMAYSRGNRLATWLMRRISVTPGIRIEQ
jgi:hypothetical protein